MKFKKLTAVLLSAVTLVAAPSFPTFHSADSDITITAEAANTLIAQISSNLINYALYKDSSGSKYAVVTGSDSNVQNVTINATITYGGATYPITKIEADAFASRSKLNEVDLSKAYRLTSIESNAFKNSTVKTVRIGSTRLTIKTNAFNNTKSLNTVTVTADTDTVRVAKHAFYESSIQNFYCYCYGVIISSDAFEKSSLKNVLFTSHVHEITLSDDAFSCLQQLYSVEINNNNANISMGNRVFFGCSALYKVYLPDSTTEIPSMAFKNCSKLTIFSIPSGVTDIQEEAFCCSGLPNTVIIRPNVSFIDPTAFIMMENVNAFYVYPANNTYKSVDGILYSKDGSTLLSYPAKKETPEFSTDATIIPNYAIYHNPYLKTLSIIKLKRASSDKIKYPGLTALESLSIPSSDFNTLNYPAFENRYAETINQTKLKNINGEAIVEVPSNNEPQFNKQLFKGTLASYINDHFEDYTDSEFLKYYIDEMAKYVVSTQTTSSMTDMQKAIRLRNWIMNRVKYDPKEKEYINGKEKGLSVDESWKTAKNHVDASVFLHQRDGERYTVCDGYARCYMILMNKANIETHYIYANNTTDPTKTTHAWNLVKINKNYYHVDITWDDEYIDEHPNASDEFSYFMCSDTNFRNDNHKDYSWKVKNLVTSELRNISAPYSMDSLGRLKSQTINQSFVDYLRGMMNNTNLSPGDLVKGDLNFNGRIDNGDVDLMQEYVNKDILKSMKIWRFTELS